MLPEFLIKTIDYLASLTMPLALLGIGGSLKFESIKKESKLTLIATLMKIVKQLFAHFIDGSDVSMKRFDHHKQDEFYAPLLENRPDEMASSHQIKRFF